MINFRSKKGVTLTELIIVCGVMAVIIAAASTVLITGGRIFRQGANTTNAMGQIEIVEKWLQNSMSVANNTMRIGSITDPRPANSVAFYFDDKENLHISSKGPQTTDPEESTELDNIRNIKIKFTTDATPLSRVTASYTIETKTGSSASGAVVMNNISAKFDWIKKEFLVLKNDSTVVEANCQTEIGLTVLKASY